LGCCGGTLLFRSSKFQFTWKWKSEFILQAPMLSVNAAKLVSRSWETPERDALDTLLGYLVSLISISSFRPKGAERSADLTLLLTAAAYSRGENIVEVELKVSMQATLTSAAEAQAILECSEIAALFGHALLCSHSVLVIAGLRNRSGTRVGEIEAHFETRRTPL
jgi:hypothetical protein